LGIWARKNWIRLERRQITLLKPDLLLQFGQHGAE
jgi:hypothetical protein